MWVILKSDKKDVLVIGAGINEANRHNIIEVIGGNKDGETQSERQILFDVTIADGALKNSSFFAVSGSSIFKNSEGNAIEASGSSVFSGGITQIETLNVTGITTLTGKLNANGGIKCDNNKFTVADLTGNTAIAGTLTVNGPVTINGGSIDTTDTAEAVKVFENAANLTIGGKSSNILIGASAPISGQSTTVTIGSSNDDINVLGNLTSQRMYVKENLITLNTSLGSMNNAGMLILGTSNLAYIRVASDLARFKIKAPSQLNEGYIATTADVAAEATRAIAAENAISTELTELKDSLDPANQQFQDLLLNIFKNFLLGDIGTMVIDYTYPKLQPTLLDWFDSTTNVAATAVEAVMNWWAGIDFVQIIEDWWDDLI